MTDQDPTLERWQQGETRRAWMIGILTGLVVLLAAAVVALTLSLLRNSEEDRLRACEQTNQARAEIRAAIVETVLVLIDEVASDPPSLSELVVHVEERLETTLPDQAC